MYLVFECDKGSSSKEWEDATTPFDDPQKCSRSSQLASFLEDQKISVSRILYTHKCYIYPSEDMTLEAFTAIGRKVKHLLEKQMKYVRFSANLIISL